MTNNSLNRHSFILRFWRENENQAWKGMVQHTNSGASMQINSLEDLLAFIGGQKDGLLPHLEVDQKPICNTGDSNLK